jgi:hypothetical protein
MDPLIRIGVMPDELSLDVVWTGQLEFKPVEHVIWGSRNLVDANSWK